MSAFAAPSPTSGRDVDARARGRAVAQAGAENFPVALRVLPRDVRAHLIAVYAYARHIDDLGDRFDGDRLAALDEATAELDRAFAGTSTHPVFVDVVATVQAVGATRQPLDDLIEANRLDQVKQTYDSWDELLGYCALSANPVGRLVLAVFGVDEQRAVELSDRVCTGLQIVEHLQDLREDALDGRVYLPLPDFRQFGVDVAELVEPVASSGLRRLVAHESGRARTLLQNGLPLLGYVHGARRLALAGFVGGGMAQLDEIARRKYDVLQRLAKASKIRVATRTAGLALATGQRS